VLLHGQALLPVSLVERQAPQREQDQKWKETLNTIKALRGFAELVSLFGDEEDD